MKTIVSELQNVFLKIRFDDSNVDIRNQRFFTYNFLFQEIRNILWGSLTVALKEILDKK